MFSEDTLSIKINIPFDSLERLISDKRILESLKLVEMEFPFSILEKRKFYSLINNVEDAIWVSSVKGEILYANQNVEEYSQTTFVEKIKEEDFFVGDFIKLNNILTKQVQAIKQTVNIENYEIKNELINEEVNFLKIPLISDLEIVAFFNIISKSEPNLLKNIDSIVSEFSFSPMIAIDLDCNILKVNSYFLKKLNIYSSHEITNLTEIIGVEASNEIKFNLNKENQDSFEIKVNKFSSGNVENELFLHVEKFTNKKNQTIAAIGNLFQKEAENQKLMVLKMYESLLKITTEPIFIYDSENLKFLDVNEVALEFYGFSKNQFLNMDLTDLYAPEDIQTLIETSQDEIEKEKFSQPVKHKKNDGTTVIVKIIRALIDYGDKSAFLTIVKDANNNEQSAISSNVVEEISDFAGAIFIKADAEGFIEEFRDSQNIFNVDKNDLVGKTFISLLGDKYRSEINKKIFLSKVKEEVTQEISLKTKTEKQINAKVKFLPIINGLGEITNYQIIIKVLEEEKKSFAKIERDGENTLDASFLSHLFHELLTPINVIVGFTHELSESMGTLDSEQKEFISIINENQKSLMQLMDSATEYSTLMQNRAEFSIQNFAFVEILDEIENNVKRFAEQKNVSLRFGKISSSIELENDRNRMIHLLSMLWEFSVRATKSDFVIVSASGMDDKLQVTFRDEKKSISEKLIKSFNEFLSAEEALIRSQYGVSRFTVRLFRMLSNLMHVEFSEKIEDGVYKAFVVEFPKVLQVQQTSKKNTTKEVIPEKIETKQIIEEKNKKTTTFTNRSVKAERTSEIKVNLSKLKCLLMEDQIDSQILFKSQLKELARIDVVASFEDSVPLLKSNEYDFIVMDINLLGEYNGLEAMREIRKIPKFKNIPIIAATAYIMPGDRENYINAGFNDFISKPIMKENLIKCLNNVLA